MTSPPACRKSARLRESRRPAYRFSAATPSPIPVTLATSHRPGVGDLPGLRSHVMIGVYRAGPDGRASYIGFDDKELGPPCEPLATYRNDEVERASLLLHELGDQPGVA